MKESNRGYLPTFDNWNVPVAETEEELKEPVFYVVKLENQWEIKVPKDQLVIEPIGDGEHRIFIGQTEITDEVVRISGVMPQPSHKLIMKRVKKE